MSLSEAIQILVDCAGRWGENAEEDLPRRINAADSDEILQEMAGDEFEQAKEIRDLWKAVEVAAAHLNKPIEGAPR